MLGSHPQFLRYLIWEVWEKKREREKEKDKTKENTYVSYFSHP